MDDKKNNHWRPTKDGITLTWSDLYVDAIITNQHFFSRSSTTHKNIINNVTGAVKAGTFVALMGPSGSGKSTLMGALANRNARDIDVSGDIRINGDIIGNNLKKISGYMDQHDLFINCLTVREHLYFMARMKLSRKISNKEIHHLIDDILIQLGLAHRADTRIGGNDNGNILSGGEKKRVSFAAEMLTNPPLLFCDEPTTGLDAYSAQTLVQIMKEMASQGKTIICTIHQPSSQLFDEFNQLILLSEGRIAFMGDSASALLFFERNNYFCPGNYNAADFFMRCLAINSASGKKRRLKLDKLCDEFTKSEEAQDIYKFVEYEMTTREKNSGWQAFLDNGNVVIWPTRFGLLLKRSFLQLARDSSLQFIQIINQMILTMVLALCYAGTAGATQTGVQSVQGALYLFITENTYTPMFSIINLFPRERPLFLREYKNGLYSPTTFYIAKIASITPGLFIEALLFACIVYWQIGLRDSLYAFLITAATLILIANVSAACGCFFSNAFSTMLIARSFIYPYTYILMITSGYFMSLNSLPYGSAWIKYLSWFMYSNEIMTIVQWENVENIPCASNLDLPCLHNGQEVMEKYSVNAANLHFDIMAMLLLYVGFHTLALCFFSWKAKKNT